jgi:thiamine-phosphate pyrophosphorylase
MEPAQLAGLGQPLVDADVAAVLVRLPQADPRAQTERIKMFASLIQPSGAALLTDGHADLVARGGADGAHFTGIDQFQEARPSLQPQRIAGVGGLATRHDAMVAGESGADYVMFGEPDADGARPAIDAIAERVGWWAEVFEIPCVGYAATIDEAATLAAAGADFVLLEHCIWSDIRDAAASLMDAGQAIRQGRRHPIAAESK